MENGDPRGMADLIAFGGVLALYGCGHPGLMFSPGREDASVSDADILPAANESPEVMVGTAFAAIKPASPKQKALPLVCGVRLLLGTLSLWSFHHDCYLGKPSNGSRNFNV
eukprot:1142810-Pelagomonas_calceolata.AAC.5